jgi:hypothetical protein
VKLIIWLIILIFQGAIIQAQPAFQQQFGAWLVFTERLTLNRQICFTVSEPQEKNLPDQYRSPPYIAFTKIEKGTYEFMAYSGYRYNDRPVEVSIDKTYNFKLAPLEMEAWPFNDLTDKEIIKYAPKGRVLTVKSTNFRNQEVLDTYSLEGLFRALNYLEETCK